MLKKNDDKVKEKEDSTKRKSNKKLVGNQIRQLLYEYMYGYGRKDIYTIKK